mgnify:FL=1
MKIIFISLHDVASVKCPGNKEYMLQEWSIDK